MRKLLTAAIIFCGIATHAQLITPINPTVYGSNNLRLKSMLALHIPRKTALTTNSNDPAPQIFYNTVDSSIWAWSPERGYFPVGIKGRFYTADQIDSLKNTIDLAFVTSRGSVTTISLNVGGIFVISTGRILVDLSKSVGGGANEYGTLKLTSRTNELGKTTIAPPHFGQVQRELMLPYGTTTETLVTKVGGVGADSTGNVPLLGVDTTKGSPYVGHIATQYDIRDLTTTRPAYQVYATGTSLDDGIPQLPRFKFIDHLFISDFDAAVNNLNPTDVINVKSQGAIGDGIANDRVALQTSADLAFTTGKAVYLPKGIYNARTAATEGNTAQLFVSPGLVMFGDGDESVIQRDPLDLGGYTIALKKSVNDAAPIANRNYTFKNFKIVGLTGFGYEPHTAPTNTDGGLFLTGNTTMNRVRIEGVTAEKLNKEAFAVWGVNTLFYLNNRVKNTNHDAFNPEHVSDLFMFGNRTDSAAFGIEYNGQAPVSFDFTKKTTALIEDNKFINMYNYGIRIEAGDNVKVSGNQLSAIATGTPSQDIGLFMKPNRGHVGTVEFSYNQIKGFKDGGIGTSLGIAGDSITQHFIIKGNDIEGSGINGIWLDAYDNTRIRKTEISNNTIYNWNVINNGNAFQYAGIGILDMKNVNIFGNRLYHDSTGTNAPRTDPLYISNTDSVWFYNNNVNGNISQFYTSLEIRKANTNTNTWVFNNPGLGLGNTGELVSIPIIVDAETTAVPVATTVMKTIRAPFGFRLTEIRASLTTASSSGLPTFDVKQNGTTLFSTNLSIDATEKTSVTAATPAVLAGTSSNIFSKAITDDAELTFVVVTQGTGAAGVKFTLLGYK